MQFRLIILVSSVALFVSKPVSAAGDELEVWLKAFIPNKHETNPNYVRIQPNLKDKWMIPDPVESDYCFSTDNRTFSEARDASARMTSSMKLYFAGGTLSATSDHQTGPSHKLWCKDGSDREAPRLASTGNMHFGNAVQADGIIQFTIEARANNPFVTGSPSIYYAGNFYFTKSTGTLKFKGSIGKFPAFEAYARLNNGPVRTIFKKQPDTGSNVWDLFNFGGLGLRNIESEVKL